jgi:glycosyltransferase involved in cell wall biosynthesis
MVEETKVTALLPAYNSARFIQSTLDSLSAQTRENFDVIISVDSCDDYTYAICRAHAVRDARFSVFKQEARLGYVGNCNFLLDQADADYVFFAFHDDLVGPQYVAKLCSVLDRSPNVIMSYSDVQLTKISGDTEICVYPEMDGIAGRVKRGNLMLWRVGFWWVPNRGVFRLREARKINGLKKHAAGDYSVDLPWLFHMSLLGGFARVPETLCFKFYQIGSMTRLWERSRFEHYALFMACMRELWHSHLSLREKLQIALPFLPGLAKLRVTSLLERMFKY